MKYFLSANLPVDKCLSEELCYHLSMKEDIDMTQEDELEPFERKGKGKTKKDRTDPFKMYGDKFSGSFQKIGEVANMIPHFKEYYFEMKRADPNFPVLKILINYNEKIHPQQFFPYPAQYQRWRKKWDTLLYLEMDEAKKADLSSRRFHEMVDLVGTNSESRAPDDNDLERGTNVLGGMLLNDAMHQLQNDQEMEDVFSSDELMKRKGYVLNVFNYVTRKVQGKENLKLKRSAEGRETAGFLMGLINRAITGKVGDDDLLAMENGIIDLEAKQ